MRKENSDFHDLINIFENESCSCYLVLLAFLLFIFSFFRDKFVMVKTELVDDVMSTMFPSEVPICSLCLPFFLSIYFYVCLFIIICLSLILSIYLSIYFQFISLLVSIIVYFSLFILLPPSLFSSHSFTLLSSFLLLDLTTSSWRDEQIVRRRVE